MQGEDISVPVEKEDPTLTVELLQTELDLNLTTLVGEDTQAQVTAP
jgi:hypothetical protein